MHAKVGDEFACETAMNATSDGAAAASSSNRSLAAELAALRERQLTLLEAARSTSVVDDAVREKVENTFAKIPEYLEKIRRARSSMDELSARTEGMRRRLVSEQHR